MNDTDTNTREERMPASHVMKKYRKGTLRSGSKHGRRVKSKKQATAIMLSEARKEGYPIPKRHSGKHGKMRGRKYGRK